MTAMMVLKSDAMFIMRLANPRFLPEDSEAANQLLASLQDWPALPSSIDGNSQIEMEISQRQSELARRNAEEAVSPAHLILNQSRVSFVAGNGILERQTAYQTTFRICA